MRSLRRLRASGESLAMACSHAARNSSRVSATVHHSGYCAHSGSRVDTTGKPAHTLTPLVPAPEGMAASAYYLRFDVLDIPGVVAEIAGCLAEAQVSIESMLQRGRNPGEAVSIVMITHETPQLAVARALKSIATSDKVLGAPSMIPMETG